MTDSMNFGPEWLRNLSSDGSTSGVGTRPQLADYRYGREEMLTLFTKGLRPPSSLINFPMLYANTAQGQLPLALTPVTDDERSSGSLGGWSSSGGGSIRGNMTGGTGLSTGSRGGGRSVSLVGTGRGGMVGRGGIRGGSSGGGGGWVTTNHNGSNIDATEWSPRKEYMSGGGGGGSYRSQSLVTDNWRKGARYEAGGVDGDGGNLCGSAQQGQDGWRQGQQIRSGERSASSSTSEQPPTQRWVQRSTSWRDGDPSSTGGGPTTSRGPQQRRVWDEDNNHHQQQLPEWALEQVSEPGGGTPVAGSFDATGAFHGELHKSTSQQNIGTSTDKVELPLATSRSALSLVKSETGQCGVNNRSYEPSLSKLNKEQAIDSTNAKRQSDDAKSKENNSGNVKENVLQQQPHIDKGKSVQQLINGSVNGVALNKTDILENSNVDRGRNRDDEDFDRLQEDLVLKLVVDEEPSTNNGLGVARGGDVGISVVNHAQPPPPPNLLPPQADKWFYQDPQGDLQGPFMARDMAEWYGAGYFSVALLVRRGCDERFFRLGDLVALCQGGNPFQVRPLIQPPPLLLLDNREQLQEIEQRKATGPSVVGAVNGPVTQGPSAGPAPMLPDHPDLLQLQILQQQIAYRQHSAAQHQAHQQQFNNQTAPVQVQPNHRNSIVETSPASWTSSMQQRDLLTQQLLQQQQQHIHQQTQQQQQQQVPPSNPLMHMISQMQQQQGVTKSGLIDQVPVQTITAPLQQQPSTQPPPTHAPSTTQPLNPLEALIAQMGNLQSPVTQTSPLHSTNHSQSHPASHQQQTPTSTPAQSNPLLELIRMKQQQRVVSPMQQVQQQQPAATQLEQLAMWQKNHHLQQHIQHQQQQQQWRVLQQQGQQVQGLQQEQSVGLWDISNPTTTTTLPHQSTTIASVINDQHSLSHHSSPSPPTQQQQQQIIPTPQVQHPSILTSDSQAHAPLSVPQVQEEADTTPGKKKKAAASDSVLVEKKKDEERQKKKELIKKQDSEKKQQSSSGVDEKLRKKEEEKAGRIKEEKAKQRESDEKKAKENEQKRKAKEQRKIDEENKRKTEEQKRLDDIDRERQAARERGSENFRRLQQAHEVVETPSQSPPQSKVHSASPAVPWQLSTFITSSATLSKPAFQSGNLSPPAATNLADIQRAEREKRTLEQQQQLAAIAATAALYQQQQQLLQLEREHQENSKTFSWASKPLKVEKVKSLAEIQAEEHELFVKKQAEEQRLAAIKEKEAAAVPTAGIWSGQSLTWASENISSYNIGGFWDETPRSQKQVQSVGQQISGRMPSGANSQQMAKQLSSTGKSLPSNVISVAKKQQQSLQPEGKNTGAGKNNNNNNDSTDEFRNWCSKMLANMNANVDVPTFIGFLRDIESAFDVREYCRDYLGDSGATQQFAAQFLEKRRLFKPNRSVAHTDDMCAPAPALTPNHHAGGVATGITTIAATITTSASYASAGLREPGGNNVISMDFQEVKVKGKKVKKSKMLKVDSRILGFSVTAAPDRFNVGDRDYGDTT